MTILPKAEDDLADLDADRSRIIDAILDAFDGMKGERVTRFFKQGTTTSSIDRLDGSTYPGSIRLHVFADHRATLLCLPAFEQAYVTHVFHKSRDPKYRNAVPTHDGRAAEFIETFARFMTRRR